MRAELVLQTKMCVTVQRSLAENCSNTRTPWAFSTGGITGMISIVLI